jgi:ATP-binding cassette subfamily F protein 3
VQIFPGNYEDYLWRKSGKPLDLPVETVSANNAVVAAPVAHDRKRVNPMKLQKMQDRCRSLEVEIAGVEARIASLEAELGDFKSAEESLRVVQLLDEQRGRLEQLMSEWEELSAAIEVGG